MEIRHDITLDVSRPEVQCVLKMSTGDISSHKVVISLRNKGEPVSLDDVSGYIYAKKPDNTEVTTSAVAYSDAGAYPGCVVFMVAQQTLAAVGRVLCRAVLCGTQGEELYSPIFAIDVTSNAALDASITSQSDYGALTDAKLEAQAWAEGKKGAQDVEVGAAQYNNNAKYYYEQAGAVGNQKIQEAEAWAKGTKNGVAVASGADQYQNNAKYYAENVSQAWATGAVNGVAVGSGVPQYQKSAKYYAEQAGSVGEEKAQDAEAWAKGTRGGNAVASNDPQYGNNAKYYAEQADEAGQAWATGKINNTDVGSSAPQYHNNAKYYAEQAETSVNKGGYIAANVVDEHLVFTILNCDGISFRKNNNEHLEVVFSVSE